MRRYEIVSRPIPSSVDRRCTDVNAHKSIQLIDFADKEGEIRIRDINFWRKVTYIGCPSSECFHIRRGPNAGLGCVDVHGRTGMDPASLWNARSKITHLDDSLIFIIFICIRSTKQAVGGSRKENISPRRMVFVRQEGYRSDVVWMCWTMFSDRYCWLPRIPARILSSVKLYGPHRTVVPVKNKRILSI